MLHQHLLHSVETLLGRAHTITEERRQTLQVLADRIATAHRAVGAVQVLFICTHNSRRSMMAQLWAAAGAHYFGLRWLHAESGGTEVTALHPNTAAAARRFGFEITPEGDGHAYLCNTSPSAQSLRLWSKLFSQAIEPDKMPVAVMTCSEADGGCPFVAGASARISLPYADPKSADGTDDSHAAYDSAMEIIGKEILFTLSRVAQALREAP